MGIPADGFGVGKPLFDYGRRRLPERKVHPSHELREPGGDISLSCRGRELRIPGRPKSEEWLQADQPEGQRMMGALCWCPTLSLVREAIDSDGLVVVVEK